jgi:hypothetical protein
MLTVFLAFVIFTQAEKAHRIVEGFRTLDDCLVEARRRNTDTLNSPAKPGEGYVCFVIRAET